MKKLRLTVALMLVSWYLMVSPCNAGKAGGMDRGWYLMTPPYAVDKAGHAIPGTVKTKDPLSDWLPYNHVFDSLTECEKERQENPRFFKKDPVRYQANLHALCVRTDDPRLAK
jgi:hypothetical protein